MTDLSSGALQLGSPGRAQDDSDPGETAEWLEAFDAVVQHVGRDRAHFLFERLAAHALAQGVESSRARVTPYVNTIAFDQQPRYPGDLELEERLPDPPRVGRVLTRRGAAHEHPAATLRAMHRRRICSKWVSIPSFAPRRPTQARAASAISCISSRTRRRVCMRGHIWKDS